MSSQGPSDMVSDDPAAMGFAMLMAHVETAVNAANQEIVELGRFVEQGFGNLPGLYPQTALPSSPRPATSAPAGVDAATAQPSPVAAGSLAGLIHRHSSDSLAGVA